MNSSWFFDENFNGVPDDFFDDAIKYLDFPLEDVEPHDDGEDWETKFKHLEPPPSNILAAFSSGLCDESSNESSKLNMSSLVSPGKSSQLKQWPTSAEASSSRSIPLNYNSSEGKYSHQFRTSSPVSVLESSGSSWSGENSTSCPKFVFPVKRRPRSKLPRPRRQTFPFISISNPYKKFHPLAASESESESESYLDEEGLNHAKKKQKRKNLMLLSCTVDVGRKTKQPVETRKCSHCQVTKTPQWREGPMGPKTLCNACGVRYRSGRLLPEYRPAASPTFVPSLHSNSHRTVLEMRKKTKPVAATAAMDASLLTAPPGYSF